MGQISSPARIDPACPTSAFPVQVGGKWTGMIIVCLSPGARRFTELRDVLGGITPKVLTQTLRAMERDGLVIRDVFEENPPRVQYTLTPLGRSLMDVIDAARAWSDKHLPALIRARSHHGDSDHPSNSSA